MYCSKCGNEIKDNEKFCPNCGEQNSYVGTKETSNQPDTEQVNNSTDGYQPISDTNKVVSNPNDEANFGYALLGFFLPMVGIILYFIWAKQYPLRAKSCIKGFLAGVVLYVLFYCCLFSQISNGISDGYSYYDTIVRTIIR